jgi:hypothetical protein
MRNTTDLVGYAASALVLLTFVMTEMRPLRLAAILSNIAFISYGALHGLPPILCLHLVLLPLNVVRLHQLGRTPAATLSVERAERAEDGRWRITVSLSGDIATGPGRIPAALMAKVAGGRRLADAIRLPGGPQLPFASVRVAPAVPEL